MSSAITAKEPTSRRISASVKRTVRQAHVGRNLATKASLHHDGRAILRNPPARQQILTTAHMIDVEVNKNDEFLARNQLGFNEISERHMPIVSKYLKMDPIF